jgi:outer membrane putative beta-barrel porin/alpha-amylase
MLTRIAIACLALILCAFALLHAQDQPAAPATHDTSTSIATDRPAVTDSSVVVPAGSIQAENGFLETKTDGQNIVDGPETLLRYGVLAKTELRLTVPDYFYNTSTRGGQTTGFGDVSLGVKQQLGPISGFDVSAVVFLSFPTGANNVSSGGYDPGLQVPWSRALSANWTVAGMLSLYWPTQNNRRNLTGESTILLDRQLTKPWDAFIEYAGDFPERNGNRHLLHVGTAFKLANQHQLDFHFGVGLSPAAPDHFVGIGYSFRF